MVALNKITKDRYLPVGPEMEHSAQIYDISGDKMELLYDFPTHGEPHYAAGIPAELLAPKSKKFYKLADNKHPYATLGAADAKVVRDGKDVHIYMSTIRSHFTPDNIEGVKVGDKVYFHITNQEQDFDGRQQFRVIDYAGADQDIGVGTQASWGLAILLYRFLFRTSPRDAGLC